ncbi:MAG: MaoC family dehydratase [Chloroflexi bacterium]|nr:MaoC family dehydratase [Chloroflexota bacterium]
MKTPLMPRRMVQDVPFVGAKAAFTRTLTESDVSLFIGVTWDMNPLHTDDSYVSATPIKKRIVPGLLTASLLTHLGGLWAFLANEFHFELLAPVYIGETITAEAEVIEVSERGKIVLKCRCINAKGEEVLRAEIKGFPGKFEA